MRHPFQTALPSPWMLWPMDQSSLFLTPGSAVVQAWPAANRAIFVPFSLPSTQRVSSVAIYCATASGTFDLGLYDETGLVRLASMGSTTLVAASKNVWTPSSPIIIEAGRRFYIGVSVSNTTATICRSSTSNQALTASGHAQQTTAHPLPDPAVPESVASNYLPIINLTFVQ